MSPPVDRRVSSRRASSIPPGARPRPGAATRTPSCLLALLALLAALAHPALADDAYEVTTPGVPGTGGLVPTLAGEGPATPGSQNTLLLADALANAPTFLVFGVAELAAPLAGGVLGPVPQFVVATPSTDADGALAYTFRMPPDAPAGLDVWLQLWVRDAAATAGLAASNTVKLTVQPSVPTALLSSGATYTAGSQPGEPILADLDGNGALDLAVVSSGSSEVSVFLGAGDGSLGAAAHSPVGEGPVALAAGDLDGDAHLDLVVANQVSEHISVLLGSGDGTFAAGEDVPVGGAPSSVALADLDLDGQLDLAVTRALVAQLDIRFGQGDGTFTAGSSVSVGAFPADVVAADVDADGLIDLVTADLAAGTVSVVLGTGGGAFAPAQGFGAGGFPARLASEDVDGDGHLDLAVVSGDAVGTLSVLTGDGNGSFAAPVSTPVDRAPQDLWLGDLDGDGVPDAAVSTMKANGRGQVEVLLGEGDGTFVPLLPPVRAGSSAGRITVGELGADDRPELVVASSEDFFPTPTAIGVSVFRGAAKGGFEIADRYGIGTGPLALDIGDFDGDGVADVAVLRAVGFDGLRETTVRLGMDDGTLGPQSVVAAPAGGSDLFATDLDGDGSDDLVVWQPVLGDTVHLMTSAGGGSFDAPVPFEPGGEVWDLTSGDADGDGDVDLVGSIVHTNMAWIAHNDGAGSFAAPEMVGLPMNVPHVRVGDLDGDDVPDLLALTANVIVVAPEGEPAATYQVAARLGTGGGSFAEPVTSPVAAIPFAVELADVDGDSTLDLVLAGLEDALLPDAPASLVTLLGEGDGTFAALVATAYGEFSSTKLAVDDLTGDGIADAVVIEPFDTYSVLPGLGDGRFDPSQRFLTGQGLVDFGLADLDADGNPDVATTHFTANNVWLHINQLAD